MQYMDFMGGDDDAAGGGMMDSFIPGAPGGGSTTSGDDMASSFVPGGGTSMSGDAMASSFVPGGFYGGQATAAQDSFDPSSADDTYVDTGDGIDLDGVGMGSTTSASDTGITNVGPSYGASNAYNAEETGNYASNPSSISSTPT